MELLPDSEGAWICAKHKKEREGQPHGSNCFRCTKERFEQLRNQIIDMQNAIIGWREKLAYSSEDDLIGTLDEMIEQALKAGK